MFYLNESLIQPTIFPDKTSQIWKLFPEFYTSLLNCDKFKILWTFEDEREIIQILQLLILLKNDFKNPYIILDCPFLLYGRQDKIISNSSCFGLEVFCRIFGQFIDELHTFDAHNPSFFENKDICPFNFVNTLPYKEIEAIIERESINLIVYPDKGASARYPQLSAKYKWAASDKLRDQLTGEITGMTMPEIDEYQRILVLDDIADGAYTFIKLTELLNKYYPVTIMLYVSHGIFSKGVDCLFHAGYSKVFTKNGQAFSDFKMDW